MLVSFFFFQAEDGIRDLVRSRGLGDVYKRQAWTHAGSPRFQGDPVDIHRWWNHFGDPQLNQAIDCLLYTSDAADERSSVDLGGRRIIKKKRFTDGTGHIAPYCEQQHCQQSIISYSS